MLFYKWCSGGSNSEESIFNAGDVGSIPGREDTPEKGMATLSSVLSWRITWTEEPGGLHTVYGVTKSQTRLSN